MDFPAHADIKEYCFISVSLLVNQRIYTVRNISFDLHFPQSQGSSCTKALIWVNA